MRQFIEKTAIASIMSCVALSALGGCTAIGYWVGGAIDGPKSKVDSISAVQRVDTAGIVPSPGVGVEPEPLASLLRKASSEDDIWLHAVASPGLGFTDSIEENEIEVITSHIEGNFHGTSVDLETIRLLKPESEGVGRYGLFPDEPVGVKLRDSTIDRINGTLLRLGEKIIVLRVGNRDRGFALSTVDSIYMTTESLSVGGDPASFSISGRIVGVPCLVLSGSRRVFIPLEEIERVRVKRQVYWWGPRRIILTAVGGIVDLTVALVVANNPLFPHFSLPSKH